MGESTGLFLYPDTNLQWPQEASNQAGDETWKEDEGRPWKKLRLRLIVGSRGHCTHITKPVSTRFGEKRDDERDNRSLSVPRHRSAMPLGAAVRLET